MSGLPPFSAGYRLRPSSNRIGVIGHSMGQQFISDFTVNATRSVGLHAQAAGAWLGAVSKGQYIFPENCHFAVAGSTVKDIYTTALVYNANGMAWNGGSATTMLSANAGMTQLQAILASPAQMVILWNGGHNNFGTDSAAKILFGTGDDGKGLKYVVDQLTGAGKIVVLMVDPPSGNSGATSYRWTASQLKQVAQVRNWILKAASLYPGQVYSVDTWPDLQDTNSATVGDNVAGYFQDAVHCNAQGSVRVMKRIKAVLDSIGVPYVPPRVHTAGDVYDATNNPTGNLISSGALYGATAAMPGASGGVTYAGNAPANGGGMSWSASGGAQAGTLTLTGSMVSTSTGNWFQVVITGTTASNASPHIDLVQTITTANLSAGDVIASYGEFEIDAASTGFEGVTLRTNLTRSSGFTSDAAQLLMASDTSSVLDPTALGLMGSPVVGTWNGDITQTATGAETAGNTTIVYALKNSATVNATIRVRNVATRKVQ